MRKSTRTLKSKNLPDQRIIFKFIVEVFTGKYLQALLRATTEERAVYIAGLVQRCHPKWRVEIAYHELKCRRSTLCLLSLFSNGKCMRRLYCENSSWVHWIGSLYAHGRAGCSYKYCDYHRAWARKHYGSP